MSYLVPCRDIAKDILYMSVHMYEHVGLIPRNVILMKWHVNLKFA